MEHILTSVNRRIIALITAVNHSNPLVGNSLREKSKYDHRTRGRTLKVISSLSFYCYFQLQALDITLIYVCMRAQQS